MKKTILSFLVGGLMLSMASIGFAAVDQTSTTTSTTTTTVASSMCNGQYFQKLFQQLNLTSAQKQQVSQLMQQYQPKFTMAKTQLKTYKTQLSGLLGKQYDASKVSKVATQYGNTMSQLIMVKMEFMNKVYTILTPAQQQQLQQIIQTYMKK